MPLKAYLVERMKLGIVKGKLAAWTIKRLKADNDNVREETTTGFAGLAPENAEDYTALVAQGGEMQEVAQGRQVDEAAIPQGVGSVSVAGSQGTQVNLAAPSLGTTSLRPGGGIIVPQCTKHALNTYYATDHLGTVRFTKTVDDTGAVTTTTHDYEPFGVEIAPTDECDNTHRFTGHERDLETGNDYMHFRFFSSNMGRFQKPDSNFDSPLSNPQGWNLYSYVKRNPVNFNDPTGHMGVYGLSAVMQFATDADNQSPLPPMDGGETDQSRTQTDVGKLMAATGLSGDAGQDLENVMKAINTDASHGPAPGAGNATNEQEHINPVTGQPGINPTPQQGVPGDIRASKSNPHVGEFGESRSEGGKKKFHPGLDINAPSGTPIHAMADGKVSDIGNRGQAGNRIEVTLPDGTKNYYAHLSGFNTRKGADVRAGDVIGLSGTSGNAKGLPKDQEHVHVAVVDNSGNRVNPKDWLNGN